MIRFALAVVALVSLINTAAAQTPAAGASGPPNLVGRWSGHWVSDGNGHTGPLHGRFRPVDAETYRVAFRGRFWGVFPFWYRTTMRVAGAGDGVVLLTASQRLGPLGTFTTTAVATSSTFDAAFSSRNDSGRFTMSRRR